MRKLFALVLLSFVSVTSVPSIASAQAATVNVKNQTKRCFVVRAEYIRYEPRSVHVIGNVPIKGNASHTYRYNYTGEGAVSMYAEPCEGHAEVHHAYVNDVRPLANFWLVQAGDHYEIDFRGP